MISLGVGRNESLRGEEALVSTSETGEEVRDVVVVVEANGVLFSRSGEELDEVSGLLASSLRAKERVGK